MPLYLLIQLVPAWLRDSGVSLAEIGLFALVGLALFTWKFLVGAAHGPLAATL